jgi:carboxypeptidase D
MLGDMYRTSQLQCSIEKTQSILTFLVRISYFAREKTNILPGALMFDPVIGNYEWEQTIVPIVPFAVENNNVLGFNASFLTQLQKLDKTCGFADFRKKYLTFPPPGKQPVGGLTNLSCDIYDMVYTAAYATNPCFNVYGVAGQCPLQSDPLGYPTGLQYSYPGQPIYFNRTDVKKAMHAPLEVEWLECKGPVFTSSGGPEGEGDTSPDPIQSVLPRVIEATNRVLIANGALDMSILTDGTLLAIQNMTWLGKLGFQSQPNTSIVITFPDLQYGPTFEANGSPGFEDPQGTMGKQHFERGLMWAETYLSGHMQPQFQPRSSYRHLQWLLGHVEIL